MNIGAQLGGIVCLGHGGDHTKRIHLNAGDVCTLHNVRLYSRGGQSSFVLTGFAVRGSLVLFVYDMMCVAVTSFDALRGRRV
jgi:hypothetical protein